MVPAAHHRVKKNDSEAAIDILLLVWEGLGEQDTGARSSRCTEEEGLIQNAGFCHTPGFRHGDGKLSLPLKRHRHLNKFWQWNHASTIVITPEYVQLSFETETGPKKDTGQCVGIDVGINHLLATSDKELFGSEVKRLIATIKQKKQGSKAYKRAKKTVSCYLHNVVKDYFATHDLQLVVVEKLQDVKQGKKNRTKTFRKTLSHWNYRELLDIIQMRCEEHRVSFRSVSPYKTSQSLS